MINSSVLFSCLHPVLLKGHFAQMIGLFFLTCYKFIGRRSNIKFCLFLETVVKIKIPVDTYKNSILIWVKLVKLWVFLHYFIPSCDFGFWPDSFSSRHSKHSMCCPIRVKRPLMWVKCFRWGTHSENEFILNDTHDFENYWWVCSFKS